jgi:hypothetical protein
LSEVTLANAQVLMEPSLFAYFLQIEGKRGEFLAVSRARL